MDNGLVSVITPTYNCGRFIEETIRSVLSQTYSNWEMIIVDDCSTDDTADIVASYVAKDSRIRYIRNNVNKGAAETRNKALRTASGRWIAFLDSDDLWLPEKLQCQIEFMVGNGYAFSYHEYDEINEASQPLGIHVGGLSRVGHYGMMSCCWPGCLTVMYDASIVGLVQIADIGKNNDSALWLEVSKKATCHLLRQTHALYRRRKGSITPVGIWAKIVAHYPLFRQEAGMNPMAAWMWTFVNVFGNTYKKMFYVKRMK